MGDRRLSKLLKFSESYYICIKISSALHSALLIFSNNSCEQKAKRLICNEKYIN